LEEGEGKPPERLNRKKRGEGSNTVRPPSEEKKRRGRRGQKKENIVRKGEKTKKGGVEKRGKRCNNNLKVCRGRKRKRVDPAGLGETKRKRKRQEEGEHGPSKIFRRRQS